MKTNRTEGLIAAPFTPLKSNGAINTGVLADYVKLLRKNGVKGVFVNGTTGEGFSLSLHERMELAEAWIDAASDDFAVMVHTGALSLPESKQLTAHAANAGAAAVSVIAPFFFKPSNAHTLAAFLREIAAEASDTPFYYYHIPGMSGTPVTAFELLNVIDGSIANLAGVKYSSDNFIDLQQCVAHHRNNYEFLFGYDELFQFAWALGLRGAIGSTYNYMPGHYTRIMSHLEAGQTEQARLLQEQLVQVVQAMQGHGGVLPASKAMMRWLGVDCGPCRLPLQTLDPAGVNALQKALGHTPFFSDMMATPLDSEVSVQG